MTEQEAEAEAGRRMPILPSGVTDTRDVPRIEKERARFVEGAEWERSRLSSRVVEAAPSDTKRPTIDVARFIAGWDQGNPETTRIPHWAVNLAMELKEGGFLRASQPVQVEVADNEPCTAELWSWDYFNDLQVDPYWMRCHLVGKHDEHENSETGATWRTPAALGVPEEAEPGTLAYAQARAEADGSLDSDEDGYDGPVPEEAEHG